MQAVVTEEGFDSPNLLMKLFERLLTVESSAVAGVSSPIILVEAVPPLDILRVLFSSLLIRFSDLYGVPFYWLPP